MMGGFETFSFGFGERGGRCREWKIVRLVMVDVGGKAARESAFLVANVLTGASVLLAYR